MLGRNKPASLPVKGVGGSDCSYNEARGPSSLSDAYIALFGLLLVYNTCKQKLYQLFAVPTFYFFNKKRLEIRL